jgi:hypothetical protein
MPFADPEKAREYWREWKRKHPQKIHRLNRQNRRRLSSDNYRPPDGTSPFSGKALAQEPSKDANYTRGQTWGALHRAWIGFKIANRKEGYLERLNWAIKIQNLQSDLEIQRASFPHLGLLGDRIFLFDKEKEEEIRSAEELTKEEYEEYRRQKNQKRNHIRQIVHIDELTDVERECLPDFYGSDKVERISLVDSQV